MQDAPIPGAEHVPAGELLDRAWPRDSVVVVYAEDDERAARASRLLRGGLPGWVDAIVQPQLTRLPSRPAAFRSQPIRHQWRRPPWPASSAAAA